jgi:manganese/zinc/iron transport system permease protein
MSWYALDSWIVVVGILCALACALPGCFLVLRRMSMMGDAISHAVLPGLALAFLFTGSRASVAMFIGAAVTGVLTAAFTQWISSWGRVDRGASMGIVFTTLFALGLLLIVQAADHVDLDPGCVLYGAIELTPLDVVAELAIGGRLLEVPRAAVVLGVVGALNLVLVLLFYKELKLSSFDPGLATTVGIHAGFMHYLLMTMVAVTTVAAFEAVGSIIVIAMLIVPAATAHLLTDRLGSMLALSCLIGAAGAALGHVFSITVPAWFGFRDTSTSGMMAVALGLLFVLAALFGPRHGWLGRRLNRRRVHSGPAG